MNNRGRFAIVDGVRGVAILLMFVYHFTWDLSYFGFSDADLFGDPFWIGFVWLIVSIFLSVSGFAFALAEHRGTPPGARIRRLVLIGVCAGLVSLATYIVDAHSFVFFGILHHVFLASLLLLLLRSLPSSLLLLVGLVCLAAPYLFASDTFAYSWLLWLGLSPYPVLSVDYVPLIPWVAAPLFGLVAGRRAVQAERLQRLFIWRPEDPIGKTVRLLGRHSLLVYVIHQPILFGGLWLYVAANTQSKFQLIGAANSA